MTVKRTPLEKAAITFVNVREKKANLKKQRVAQLRKCTSKVWYRMESDELVSYDELNEWDYLYMDDRTTFQTGRTCVYKHAKNPEQWCDFCKKSNALHEEFRSLSRKITAARRTLIKAVHTATARKKATA